MYERIVMNQYSVPVSRARYGDDLYRRFDARGLCMRLSFIIVFNGWWMMGHRRLKSEYALGSDVRATLDSEDELT